MDSSRIRNIIFFTLFGIVFIFFLYIIWPFFYPIFWAAVIAIVFRPLHKRITLKKYNPNLNAFVSVTLITLIIIIPAVLVLTLLVTQAMDVFSSVGEESSTIGQSIKNLMESIKHNQFTARLNINEAFWADKFSQFAKGASTYIYEHLEKITQNVVEFIIMFALMIYTLFFFIRDGHKLPPLFSRICPLGDNKEQLLLQKFIATTRATLRSTVVIGAVQGTLGGLMFWILGIQGPLVWGVIMAVASILPTGSAIIWVPAGIIMILLSHTLKGMILLVFGTVVIGAIDNLLRPIVIGQEIEMHNLFILYSTLGGLILFGFSGFIIGPIIAAILQSLWEIYIEFYSSFFFDDDNTARF